MHFRDSEEQFAEGLEFVARDEQVIGGAHAQSALKSGWSEYAEANARHATKDAQEPARRPGESV